MIEVRNVRNDICMALLAGLPMSTQAFGVEFTLAELAFSQCHYVDGKKLSTHCFEACHL
jgi:hypothetical protein